MGQDNQNGAAPAKPNYEAMLAGLVFPRMGLWLYASIALCVLIWFLAPHMVKVGAYKLALITVAAFIGYHISRALESRGWRPHELIGKAKNCQKRSYLDQFPKHLLTEQEDRVKAGEVDLDVVVCQRAWELEQLAAAAYQRRAWVVSACMIAAALGS